MSRFMETQVTIKTKWALVTTENDETYLVPADEYEPSEGDYLETVTGYGVRESAPGYLDCTEWEVFSTLAEAEQMAANIDAEYDELES